MDKLLDKHKVQIENELYKKVMILIESVYNVEGAIDTDNNESTKLIFDNKHKVIKMISKEIERFAQENNLDRILIKDYLISVIEKKIELNNGFQEKYEEAKDIILTDNENDERWILYIIYISMLKK